MDSFILFLKYLYDKVMGNLTAKQVEEEGFPPLLEETQIFALCK